MARHLSELSFGKPLSCSCRCQVLLTTNGCRLLTDCWLLTDARNSGYSLFLDRHYINPGKHWDQRSRPGERNRQSCLFPGKAAALNRNGQLGSGEPAPSPRTEPLRPAYGIASPPPLPPPVHSLLSLRSPAASLPAYNSALLPAWGLQVTLISPLPCPKLLDCPRLFLATASTPRPGCIHPLDCASLLASCLTMNGDPSPASLSRSCIPADLPRCRAMILALCCSLTLIPRLC
jgi:hypothetical protein